MRISTILALADLSCATFVALPVDHSCDAGQTRTEAPRLVGRLLDEDREPIREASVRWIDWCYWKVTRGSGCSSRGHRLQTDPDGRFEIELEEPALANALRAIQFETEGLESYEVELPEALPAQRFDLGDIQLVRPGSTRWLAEMDDAQLEAEYHRAVIACSRNGAYRRSVETCLTEIVRRGGAYWQAFVKSELQLERTKDPREVEDLVLLTALRRIQGKPDPLAVQIVGLPELECTFPEVPTIRLRLLNVDAEGERFQFTYGARELKKVLPDDVFSRFAVEVRDTAGRGIATLPMEPVQGSIQFERDVLDLGVDLELELPLELYFQWPGAGEFQARVLYHDRAAIAEGTDFSGWIASSSTWFVIHVKSKRMRMSGG